MKWVFTLLITLNIIALAYFFTQKEQAKTVTQIPAKTIEQVVLASEPISQDVSEIPTESSTNINQLSSSEPQSSSEPLPEPKSICLGQTDVNEQTYQALQAYLAKVPHQVKKHEQAPATSKPTDKSSTLYWVHIPVSDNVDEQLADLKSKGFDTHLMSPQISLGLFRNPSGAVSIKQQAFNAGYTQVTITEKSSTSNSTPIPDTTEKIIFYRLNFAPLPLSAAVETLLQQYKFKRIVCP